MRHRATRSRSRGVLAILAALAIALLAAGCGGDDEGDGGAEGELAAGPGFDGESITVGVITPQTGPVEVIGGPLTNGNQVWFDYYNESEGGIAGQYPIEVELADSRYDAQTAVQQYNGMREDVVMLAQLLGTPITTALLPQLQSDNVIASPATLDSLWVRQPQLAPLGAPYQVQAINAMDHYTREIGGTDDVFCTMIQDDVYGEAGQEGIEFAAEQMGFEVAETARFRQGDQDFTAQIGQLAQAQCDVVFLVALPTEAGVIYGTAAQAQFAPTWMGQSPSWVDELLDSPLRPYLEQNVLIMAQGPQWGDRSVQGMADMLDRKDQYAPEQEPDFYFAFGYNQGRVVTTILEQAVENGDLSREGIVQAMEDIDTISFDGLMGDYTYGGVENRNPPRESSVFKVSGDAPFGLEGLEINFSSDAAEAFEFEGEQLPTG